MTFEACPGCSSRMVKGVCSMCGYVDPDYRIDNEADSKAAVFTAPQNPIAIAPSTELIDCPACSNRVSETAVNCPKCGFVITPEFVAAQRVKRDESKHASTWIQAVGAFVGVTIFGILWSSMSNAPPPSSGSTFSDHTAAEKVTYIDHGEFDTAATARMQELLGRLSRKYNIDEDLVAAKLLTAQELLAKKNVQMTVQQIGDAVEAASPATTAVTFDELVAAYITLREQGTDMDATDQMRGLWNDLGLQ